MRLLTAQAIADEGEIEVLGLPVPARSKQARSMMGVVPQQDNLDIELTVRQNLRCSPGSTGCRGPTGPAAVERALEVAQLTGRADTRTETCPGACGGGCSSPAPWCTARGWCLLDEPTVGPGPQVRQELWALIDALRSEGVTVLMSTHYIEEAERLADDVAVMHAGRVIAFGTPATWCASTSAAGSWRSTGRRRGWLEVEAGRPGRRPADPPDRSGRRSAPCRGCRRGAGREAAGRGRAPGEPRGRLRPADR
jgi:lipooligosaccharide transport system ATP-binding protein